jgi:hypothetical protein
MKRWELGLIFGNYSAGLFLDSAQPVERGNRHEGDHALGVSRNIQTAARSAVATPEPIAMMDDRALLEQRVAWLEREMVRLLWAAISAGSFIAGGIAYRFTVDSLGGLGALGIAVAAWIATGWYLHRHEFGGAPAHIKLIDP